MFNAELKATFITLCWCALKGAAASESSDSSGQLEIFNIINSIAPQIVSLTPKMEWFTRSGSVRAARSFRRTDHQSSSIYLTYGDVRPRIVPNIDEMSFQLMTPCKNESFPILAADQISESALFDKSKKMVLYVRGWFGSNGDSAATLAKAFHCRGEHNILLSHLVSLPKQSLFLYAHQTKSVHNVERKLDAIARKMAGKYQFLDTSSFIDTLYSWSALNTEAIGKYLAMGLSRMASTYGVENMHLIGHSLGAHIVGYAGRYFTLFTNQTVPHITGLDPANPCFNEGEILYGIQRGDATFTDIVHSNPGALGKKEPTGDADFYPEGLAPIKPGCFTLGCSHSRSWHYYAESVFPGNEYNFMGTRCNSLNRKEGGFCKTTSFPMGIAVPAHLKGNYFFSVNKIPPFGKNSSAHVTLAGDDCGTCPS